MSGHVNVIATAAADFVSRDHMSDPAYHMMPPVFAILDAWIADPPDPKLTRHRSICKAPAEHLKVKGYLR
ncbi:MULTISPECIES: hypothetical protein [unclassified Methylobacterium]|uniref:hypothetical protein n=1 Tax=unclassified Methylobacterium TaxID=2615210 RepID=UPI00226A508C|nr:MULTISPECIES: hypothetical protein [unclassified Methylobacterium]